ncbi:MAG TPA: low specificity L-threonine aldolase [Stellaceae bacterium]|nr:low specificity L-threonine aldolase [Stellaceae bacterium]
MNFSSDNVAGIAPEILAAITAANAGKDASYGEDAVSARLERRVAEVFEHEVVVFPVATGTAANALALASLVPPWGTVYCHAEAHIVVDECGAPEFYTGGARMAAIEAPHGKIGASDLARLLPGGKGIVHHMQPAAVSLTQASEAGTVYRSAEIAAIAEIAKKHGLALHMDGARFANAVAFLGCAPADLTWRAGVDALSFGATKNGAAAAEAVIFFDRAKAAEFAFRRKRGGHLFSKMRFLSAQLEAYVADELWLRNARHANAMAARLGEGLQAVPGARLRHPVEANEVFVELPEPVIDGLLGQGFQFYRWVGNCVRLVTAFDTEGEEVEALIAAARGLAGVGAAPGNVSSPL